MKSFKQLLIFLLFVGLGFGAPLFAWKKMGSPRFWDVQFEAIPGAKAVSTDLLDSKDDGENQKLRGDLAMGHLSFSSQIRFSRDGMNIDGSNAMTNPCLEHSSTSGPELIGKIDIDAERKAQLFCQRSGFYLKFSSSQSPEAFEMASNDEQETERWDTRGLLRKDNQSRLIVEIFEIYSKRPADEINEDIFDDTPLCEFNHVVYRWNPEHFYFEELSRDILFDAENFQTPIFAHAHCLDSKGQWLTDL